LGESATPQEKRVATEVEPQVDRTSLPLVAGSSDLEHPLPTAHDRFGSAIFREPVNIHLA
jgi:hypothetical protein